MTDFHVKAPCTTTEDNIIQAALQQMKLSKVKSLFVLGEQDQVIGHISARDIQSTKPTLIAKEHDIKPTEVTVKMMMTPTHHMHSLYFSELSNARVGHITRLLHELQVNYIFVLEPEAGMDKIRGMFSISRISRQLGENVTGDLSSHSVAEMSHLI
jgi:CBS-domain-containing membrane protein